jgi:hypothetical protein
MRGRNSEQRFYQIDKFLYLMIRLRRAPTVPSLTTFLTHTSLTMATTNPAHRYGPREKILLALWPVLRSATPVYAGVAPSLQLHLIRSDDNLVHPRHPESLASTDGCHEAFFFVSDGPGGAPAVGTDNIPSPFEYLIPGSN